MAENNIEEIKKNLETGKITVGTSTTLKNLKLGNIEKVFITKNCPDDVKNDIKHFSDIAEFEVIEMDITNEELGNICKKTFSISVIGFLRG